MSMEIGTGIFLSSFVLAVVILYGITKDRWSWRRIVQRAAFICLGLIALGTIIVFGSHQWDQLAQQKLVERQAAYAGLRLGMTQDEVMYAKGYPPFVLVDDTGENPQSKGYVSPVSTKNLEKGKRPIDYRLWSYELYKHNINVVFNPARTAVTQIHCYSEDMLYYCPKLGGVRDGDSEEEVLQKLGNPTISNIEGATKRMSYRDLNIEVWLTKEKVYAVAVRDPSYQRP
jgi:hypothetical protein